ncbi:MAG: methionine gamma-lyase [Lachnospiraceae bacterium]|nr:methionine gamma-lyase [Lachnospiraceae bacterium]MBQ2040824.1 methionine gamma-lyase [Lachnospiraceae bacterium]
MGTDKKGFSTEAIHGSSLKDQYGALITPIYNSSTFIFDSTAQGAARFALEEPGYIYSRLGTPTTTALEEKLAKLEHGEAGLVTATGMGAVTATIWTVINGGEEIIADKTLYGCTFEFFEHHLSRFGVTVHFIEMANEDELRAALNDKTKIVYLETPANPNLKIIDIEKTAKIAHEFNPEIKVIADNTFASPVLQRPLDLGCDIVLHSCTKYINGHGDLLAGVVVSDAETINKIRLVGIKDMTGAVLAPNEAYLVERGLKTLEVRMQRHCESAMKVARYLETNDKVEKVFYPGLESHEGHEIAKKQMDGFGGMVSFVVKGGRKKAAIVADNVKVATLAVSLGATETLIEHPASMTHSPLSEEELIAANIEPGLIRFSVGLENAEDIIDDLKQAFEKI